MAEIIVSPENKISIENRLEIIDEGIRKKYLSRLGEMEIAALQNKLSLEDDLINNIRIYKVTEIVYRKGESVTDKFTTVFNTLSTYDASVFIIIDSDGKNTDFYIGVRSNESDDSPSKRSMVTLGDTLKNTMIGNFPGVKLINEDRNGISKLSNHILKQSNIASVSVVANNKSEDKTNDQFVQGLEKLTLAMNGRQYTGIIIAENQSPEIIQILRQEYQELYSNLSLLSRIQFNDNNSENISKTLSFSEMDGKQRALTISEIIISLAALCGGGFLGNKVKSIAITGGALLGSQIAGQINGLLKSFAPVEQNSNSAGSSETFTYENKKIIDLMTLIDDSLKRLDEFDSYGMWNIAGYFISDDMSTAEIAASNYRSLMNGDKSGREVSAINSWRKNSFDKTDGFKIMTEYLSRFMHPLFIYGGELPVTAATSVSGKDLGIHLGLPRSAVPGLSVIEHAEFGKEVNAYRLILETRGDNPEDKMTLGRIFDLGKITDKIVELDNASLNMHTFITGSTGSGKSNAVYQMLTELHQDNIPFLVIEPAKGEYKDVFGYWNDVNVFSTNPKIAPLINLNPFKFPDSVHVLEHIDGLVEIFGVCWTMYDAMSAFFKQAVLKSYEYVGWDLGSSTFEGDGTEYPDFEILADQLKDLIDNSDYAAEIKSNYRGALLTRVNSLTVGLNKYIFTSEQTEYEKIFDQNCIIDISRVKSTETKALLMGLIVYILNEYREDQKTESNNVLKHITVLEEAHNLLKNANFGNTELVGKSVEMITNTIAEIRTYGEGFIIVDQSPSSVDIAAIKNTNTKIILRTPEANDREAVGRSIGLTEDQVNEIAKLPSGVAVVYQNDWINPVLTMINKAPVNEIPYKYETPSEIKPVKKARTELLLMLMQLWLKGPKINKKELEKDLKSLDLSIEDKKEILKLIKEYSFNKGILIWREDEIDKLKRLVNLLFGLSENNKNDFINKYKNKPEEFFKKIKPLTYELNNDQLQNIYDLIIGSGV